jgi:2-hydroxycyclohexanecarboxyl-CoA dehydrogenase
MDLQLSNKVVLITGAGSGIGQAIATAFASEGAKIVVNDIAQENCEETVALARQRCSDVLAAPFDVTNLSETRAALARVEQHFGRIDVLVNNAAVLLANTFFVETDPRDCEREIQVSLYGTLHCSRAVLPGMIDRKHGKIVNIVSDAGRLGQEREATYAAAKGGVIAFTKSLAREVGRHGINVNAVSPAATNTPLRRKMMQDLAAKIGEQALLEREEKIRRGYPMRRIGESNDVANAVLYLASDCARHVTGQILGVNGGYAMVG